MVVKTEYKINEVGNKYGRLLVTKYVGKIKNKTSWECICDCGNTKIVPGINLRTGQTRSCGCLHREQLIARQKKYDVPKRLRYIWHKIIDRCENEKNVAYKYYGGKGIKVCDTWHDSYQFFQWAMSNGYSENLTIDRINFNGNYEPNNCRWVSFKKQQNNKSNNRYETINGITKTVQEWCEYYEVKTALVWNRLTRGWAFEDALLKPSQKEFNGKRVMCLDTKEVFESTNKAGIKYGITGKAIRYSIDKNVSTSNGMKWKYVDA